MIQDNYPEPHDKYEHYNNNSLSNKLLVEEFTLSSIKKIIAPPSKITIPLTPAVSVNQQSKEMKCPPGLPNICGPAWPYNCFIGNPPNRCAKTPKTFEDDPECFRYCNVLNAGPPILPVTEPEQILLPKPELLTNQQSKEVNCPNNIKQICKPDAPYQCLSGKSANKCSSSGIIWERSADCNTYCNNFSTTPVSKPIPAPLTLKQIQCPNNFKSVCDQSVPFQCLAGPAINKCSTNSSRWENSNDCSSYCNVYSGSLYMPSKANRTIKITNRCLKKIWVGIYGPAFIPANGGFELGAGTSTNITVPNNWSGKIWGRTACQIGSNGELTCETGDCNGQLECKTMGQPPISLVELNLSSTHGIPDSYNLSLVNGYNLPISIKPIPGSFETVNRTDLGKFNCGSPKCSNFNMSQCPPELTIKGKNGPYCASICAAVNNMGRVNNPLYLEKINKAQVCCSCDCGPNCGCNDPKCKYGCSPFDTNPLAVGGKCNTSAWPLASNRKQYNQIFKEQCPDAYSWQFDTLNSYQCINADYEITFC